MRCVQCGNNSDKVIDSREAKDAASIRRRRECLHCGYRFTTYEVIERRELSVVKRDGRRERFAREKLEESLHKASQKRPVSRETIKEATDGIIAELEQAQSDEIPSSRIGLAVMRRLQTIDPVAFVRYASIYRQFQDVGEFLDEIQSLRKDPMNGAAHPELSLS